MKNTGTFRSRVLRQGFKGIKATPIAMLPFYAATVFQQRVNDGEVPYRLPIWHYGKKEYVNHKAVSVG